MYERENDHVSIDSQWLTSFPLFEPLVNSLVPFGPLAKPPSIKELNQILDIPDVSFVAQEEKTKNFEESYEARIFLKQEVQTRHNNWHDFFNALVWHRFIKSKRTINQLHYYLSKSRYPSKHRLAAENMLTLFDENGAVVIASNELYLNLIREHRWHELFWQQREHFHDHIKVIIFGHGLYEKALHPYVGLTAKCLLFVAQDNAHSCIDTLIARYLQNNKDHLRTSMLAPLPILGVPGWWEQNNDEQFYENKNYFRPRASQ